MNPVLCATNWMVFAQLIASNEVCVKGISFYDLINDTVTGNYSMNIYCLKILFHDALRIFVQVSTVSFLLIREMAFFYRKTNSVSKCIGSKSCKCETNGRSTFFILS